MIREPAIITDIEDEEILLCVRTLCRTYEGSAPLARDFGIDIQLVDSDVAVFAEIYAQEIIYKIEKFIPELRVTGVEFAQSSDIEKWYPVIYLERREDV